MSVGRLARAAGLAGALADLARDRALLVSDYDALLTLAAVDVPDLVSVVQNIRVKHRLRDDVHWSGRQGCLPCSNSEGYVVPWPCETYTDTLLPGETP